MQLPVINVHSVSTKQTNKFIHICKRYFHWTGYEILKREKKDMSLEICFVTIWRCALHNCVAASGLWREKSRLHSAWREFLRSWYEAERSRQTALQSADDKRVRIHISKLHVVIILLWRSLVGMLELEIAEKVITKLVVFSCIFFR